MNCSLGNELECFCFKMSFIVYQMKLLYMRGIPQSCCVLIKKMIANNNVVWMKTAHKNTLPLMQQEKTICCVCESLF